MKGRRSLRETLAESRIATVTIAVLLFWAFASFIQGLSFLLTLRTYSTMPYVSPRLANADELLSALFGLIVVAVDVGAAWVVSQWVYGVGPIRSLSRYGTGQASRNNA